VCYSFGYTTLLWQNIYFYFGSIGSIEFSEKLMALLCLVDLFILILYTVSPRRPRLVYKFL